MPLTASFVELLLDGGQAASFTVKDLPKYVSWFFLDIKLKQVKFLEFHLVLS